jgi:UDP-N-acetylmuramyl-tripeptide synthetase
MKINNLEITKITSNSKNIIKNSVFVAIKGTKNHGLDFLEDAVNNGACICVIEFGDLEKYKIDIKKYAINFLEVKDTKEFLAKSLLEFYGGEKVLPKNIITVTGTNGKSSTAFFAAQMLQQMNINNMVIGTMGIFINGNKITDSLTTPSSEDLIKYLVDGKKQGIEYVIMESSSHGLDQKRTDGIKFKGAGFTNLTQDHLDYHETMENYYQAKKRLFTELNLGYSVINVDDEYGKRLKQELPSNFYVIDYGFNARWLKINSLQSDLANNRQLLDLWYIDKSYPIVVNLLGEFQVYNILCAVGLLLSCNLNFMEIIKAIPKLKEIQGRLNFIKECKKGSIFIDFAHSPNALEEVLKILKKQTPKKLKVLFGCGGNRDKTKRPIMGNIANNLADVVYITDDNPRFEEPEDIRAEILAGIPKNSTKILKNIANRKEAIFQAIQELDEGEILLIAGKGHENGQIIKDKVLEFNDKQVVLEALKQRL